MQGLQGLECESVHLKGLGEDGYQDEHAPRHHQELLKEGSLVHLGSSYCAGTSAGTSTTSTSTSTSTSTEHLH